MSVNRKVFLLKKDCKRAFIKDLRILCRARPFGHNVNYSGVGIKNNLCVYAVITVSIHKLIFIFEWGYDLDVGAVYCTENAWESGNGKKMAVASVGNRMKRLTKAEEVRLSSVTEMARETVDWDSPMSSPLHRCIFFCGQIS